MLFVKKKPAPKSSSVRPGAHETETLERIATAETDVEVLAPTDKGSRQPASRGLFVRPAKDVTDVLELAAPAASPVAGTSAQDGANETREPTAAFSDDGSDATPDPVAAASATKEGVASSDENYAPSKNPRVNPLLASLSGWRTKAAERRSAAKEKRQAEQQARKEAASAKAQAKKDGKASSADASAAQASAPSKAKKKDRSNKGARASRAPFGGRKPTAAADSVLLATEFEGGRTVFWRMSADTLEQLEDEPTGVAFSFSPEDRRFVIEPTLSRRAAQDLAMMEIGEPVSLVLAAKEHQALYATRFARATTYATLLAPGLQALDALLKKTNRERRNLVTGFLLKGRQDRTLALLYHVDAQGEIGSLQVTANPENMDFTLAQYVASRRITADDHDVVLFDNHDLLSIASLARSYPIEPIIAGLALSHVLQMAAGVSVAVALAVGGWAGWEYSRGQQLQFRIKTLQANIQSDAQRNGQFLRQSLSSFAQVMTLDTTAQLARAQSLWLPGTTLSLQSTQNESRYQLVMPVVRGERIGTRPSVASRLTVEELVGLVDFTPPEQCQREELAVQGALNELKVAIVCQDADTALAGYRLD